MDKDVKQEGEEKLPTDTSSVKETTEEVKVTKEEVATEPKETKTETAESNKGANQRIRELNQQKKVAEEKAKSLADRLAEITSPVGLKQEPQAPTYTPQAIPGAEISPEQYQADVLKTADARVELKIQQNNAINRITNESMEAIRKYSQLDPDSDNFDKELSDTVTEATEAYVRNAPYSASVKKFVDRLMKPYLGSVAKEVGKVTEKITKQVSETALRPTSIRKGEKSAKEKSIAELEAELGIIQT